MTLRIGLCGLDSSHAEDFVRIFNRMEVHPGMRVTGLWGEPARVKELVALDPMLRPADSLADLVEVVDAVIVGDRHGGLHRPHALPFLESGRAVFVDKPFACTTRDAESMLTASARTGAPLLSASALRWQAETRALKARLAGLPRPSRLVVEGTWYPQSAYGGAIFYAIHAVELAQELIGTNWADLSVAGGDGEARVSYLSGSIAVTLALQPPGPSGSSRFGVSVEAGGIRIEQPIPLGDDYMLPVAAEIAAMLRTGRSPMAAEALLAPVALMAEINRQLAP